MPRVQLGLECCLADPPPLLKQGRFGLLMNQASLDSQLHYACDLLAERFPGRLTTLFSPQHGLWGEEQANMIETPHSHHPRWDIPIYSLYSHTRKPSPEMLDRIDCLVIDLQDVGTRVYTFAWTVVHCLEACAAAGIPVLLLDRPNPLGGIQAEGPLLQEDFRSFVGLATIPMRHGLTLGELAQLVNREHQIGAQLEVVPMRGWRRSMLWPECQLLWTPPSPNLPRFESAVMYPGQVLLEGTNLSEGRGTTQPFELCGAPYLDTQALLDALPADLLSGTTAVPVRFRPTFDKWAGQTCQGLALRVRQPDLVRSVQLTAALLRHVARHHAEHFAWLPPPYEYETERMPIDILFGSDHLRRDLPLPPLDEDAWQARCAPILLYS